MSKVLELIEEVERRDKEATKGPWLEREDYDYYQGGKYLGIGPYDYEEGKKVPGKGYFSHNVCRIESNDLDKALIANYRTAAPKLAKICKLLLAMASENEDDNFLEWNCNTCGGPARMRKALEAVEKVME